MIKTRRQHPRLRIPIEASYRHAGGDWRPGTIRTLGAGGAALECDESLAKGTLLERLRFVVEAEGDLPETRIDVAAEVVNIAGAADSSDEKLTVHGLRFMELDDKELDLLRHFVFRRLVASDATTVADSAKPLTLASGPVVIRYQRFDDFVLEVSRSLSPSGMFVPASEPLAVGTRFGFRFELGEEFALLQGEAEVVSAREQSEDGRPAGMAIRFVELDPTSEKLKHRILEQRDGSADQGGTEPAGDGTEASGAAAEGEQLESLPDLAGPWQAAAAAEVEQIAAAARRPAAAAKQGARLRQLARRLGGRLNAAAAEIDGLRLKLAQAEDESTALRGRRAELETERDTAATERDSAVAAAEEARQELAAAVPSAALEGELAEARENLSRLGRELAEAGEAAEKQRASWQTLQAELRQELEQSAAAESELRGEIEGLHASEQSLRGELGSAVETGAGLERQVEEAQSRIRDLERELEESASRNEGIQGQAEEAQSRSLDLERKGEEAQSRIRDLERQAEEAQGRSQELERQAEEAQSRSQELERQAEEAQGRSQELERQAEEAQSRGQELERQAEEAQSRGQDLERQLEEAQSRVRDLEQRLEGAAERQAELEQRTTELQGAVDTEEELRREAERQRAAVVEDAAESSRRADRLSDERNGLRQSLQRAGDTVQRFRREAERVEAALQGDLGARSTAGDELLTMPEDRDLAAGLQAEAVAAGDSASDGVAAASPALKIAAAGAGPEEAPPAAIEAIDAVDGATAAAPEEDRQERPEPPPAELAEVAEAEPEAAEGLFGRARRLLKQFGLGDRARPGDVAAAADEELPAPAAEEQAVVDASLDRVIEETVRAWGAAWSEQRVEDYVSFYASGFEAARAEGGSDGERSGWMPPAAGTELVIGPIRQTVVGPDRVSVEFEQQVETGSFSRSAIRTLELVFEGDRWKIAAETFRDTTPADG